MSKFLQVGYQHAGDAVALILKSGRVVGYVAKKGGPIKVNASTVKEVRINGKREWRQ